eukprot:2046424-Rhodomonas_salina.1
MWINMHDDFKLLNLISRDIVPVPSGSLARRSYDSQQYEKWPQGICTTALYPVRALRVKNMLGSRTPPPARARVDPGCLRPRLGLWRERERESRRAEARERGGGPSSERAGEGREGGLVACLREGWGPTPSGEGRGPSWMETLRFRSRWDHAYGSQPSDSQLAPT